jgi:hypothetical protein
VMGLAQGSYWAIRIMQMDYPGFPYNVAFKGDPRQYKVNELGDLMVMT